MSKHVKHVPQHRAAPTRTHAAPRLARGAVVASGLAVAATGLTVSGGVLTSVGADADLPSADMPSADLGVASSGTRDDVTAADLEQRTQQVSRSDRRDRRDRLDAAKVTALGTAQGQAMSRTEDLSAADPREIGRALISEFGFAAGEFDCLDALYVSESNWRIDADNPTSSAYGIPQALTQLHDLPADYLTSAESQIRWGLEYISDAYGTPCSAWGFKQGNGWY